MTDFDALSSAVQTSSEQGLRPAMDALWRATFALPEWHFAVHAQRPTEPLVMTLDGKTWLFAFTDAKRVVRFYSENAGSVGGAHALFLTMPTNGARTWIAGAAKHGIYGVQFNFAQPGWSAPTAGVDRIYAHLMGTTAPVGMPVTAPAKPQGAPRAFMEATLQYQLVTPHGVSPGTQTKVWYFDVPAQYVNGPPLQELMTRIFYDANVSLRRKEPLDEGWFQIASCTTRLVDEAAMFAWSGAATSDAARAHQPWQLARTAWEWATCYIVDDSGRYDSLTSNDFSELIAYRGEHAGRRSAEDVRTFLTKLYPTGGAGLRYFPDRATRFANLLVIRNLPGVFRRAVGAQPVIAGPPSSADIGR